MLRSGGGQLLAAAVAVEYADCLKAVGVRPVYVVAAVADHDGVSRHIGAHERRAHDARLVRAGLILQTGAADVVKILRQLKMPQNSPRKFLRLRRCNHQPQSRCAQACKQLGHSGIRGVFRPTVAFKINAELADRPLCFLFIHPAERREAFVKRRTDKSGQHVWRGDLPAKTLQRIGHRVHNALLRIRHRSVQIKKDRIPAHQPTNSSRQRR